MEHLSGDVSGLFRKLDGLAALNRPVLIAIDGRCGSGKSQLAQAVGARCACPVFHMDDFFLPPALRTSARLAKPGGNIHYERVLDELVNPFLAGSSVSFRPWDCHSECFGAPVHGAGGGLAVVEGSYALHPALRARYDLRIFVTCTPAAQRSRLLAREGAVRAARFFDHWIVLEENFFETLRLSEDCDYLLDTSEYGQKEP